ncbi:hypothetical protein CEP54_012803 [Fusarium duplospermum]|uniref:Uncharacterized protein n=1 Tax=Fusarium duplospermum TaxID=1325734 RepID=A0A428P6N2_9HYPO|nr:hypothetical protein CEP54_012803 [Fusarium duplospermum]
MLQLKTVVCVLVAGVTGVACLLVHNLEKREDQSPWLFGDKGHDDPEEHKYQSSDQASHDSSKDEPYGEPVWLLRHIDDESNPRQWALYMFGKIFELRVVRNAPFRYSIICSPRFEARVTDGVRLCPRTGFHHMGPERPCVGGTPECHLAYHLADCYICMVGRTRLTPDQVQQAFRNVKDDFGVFIATFLCQSFLDKFLKEIIARRDRASRRKKSIRQVISGRRLTMLIPTPKRRRHQSQVNHGELFRAYRCWNRRRSRIWQKTAITRDREYRLRLDNRDLFPWIETTYLGWLLLGRWETSLPCE